jgi:peptidoglycan/LPS O-acetylase OafA/YrhL
VLLTEYRGSGSIDLFRFWMRRARRLLPALFLVLVAVSVWVSVGAAEFELGRRRSDLLSALFYGSNWHLISSGDDYFTWFATASPVRHTWSLSIEEQFYLLWPLLLLLVLRFVGTTRRRVAAFGAAGIVGSLVSMALLYSPAAPSRAYYGTDARIHQVLIGALLAIAVSEVSWSRRQRRVGAVVSVAAVAAVLLAFWTVSDSDAFYYFGGSAAVALAAAALVWGVDVAPNGPVAREFALRPVRWIGKISYGVYLWHWPVVVALTSPAPAFAWLPERFGTDATRILFTFAFAFLSFYVIERPVREGTVRMLGRPAFRMAVASVAGFAVVTAAVMVATRVEVSSTSGSMFGGRENRPGWMRARDLRSVPSSRPIRACRGADRRLDGQVARCGADRVRARPRMDIRVRRQRRMQDHASPVALRRRVGSVPALLRSHAYSLRRTPRVWEPDLVLSLDRFEIADFVDDDGRIVRAGSASFIETEREALAQTTATFATETTIVHVALPPKVHPRRCFVPDGHDSPACRVPASRDSLSARMNGVLRSVVRPSGYRAMVVSLNDEICPSGVCPVVMDGVLVRYDGVHFTAQAAGRLVPILFERIAEHASLPPQMA